MYVKISPKLETSKELEEKIVNYAREKRIGMPRARRELIERGLAVEKTNDKKEVRMNERSFT